MKKLLFLVGISSAIFAMNCGACHQGSMSLSNLTPKEIEQALYKFKQGQGNPMMVNIAKGLSDDEIKEIAKEYGKK